MAPVTAAQIWEEISGRTKRGYRRKAWKAFRQDPFTSTEEGFSELIQLLSERKMRKEIIQFPDCRFLEQFHPRVFPLMEKYGQHYEIMKINRKKPRAEPTPGNCGRNAYMVAKHAGLAYVEGLAIGVFTPAMLHAWNAKNIQSQETIDWTFYSISRWTRYWGIAFTHAEHQKLCRILYKRKRMSLFFHKRIFPRVEEEINTILEKRG